MILNQMDIAMNDAAVMRRIRNGWQAFGVDDPWWVVLGDQVDKVLGVASRERVLTALLENRGLLTPVDLCESVEYVPEMIRADRLLTGFRRDSGGVRVVVDEFGGFVGVIGAESVLAVLAGWWRKPAA